VAGKENRNGDGRKTVVRQEDDTAMPRLNLRKEQICEPVVYYKPVPEGGRNGAEKGGRGTLSRGGGTG
jgi:hypothetical protein